MKKYLLIPILASVVLIFVFGIYVGTTKIFPYEFVDSSKDVLFGQKTIENNQFVNQADIDSLIKIYDQSDINEKRNFIFTSSIMIHPVLDVLMRILNI